MVSHAVGDKLDVAAWQHKIFKPALELARTTLPTLTAGWSLALGCVSTGFTMAGFGLLFRKITFKPADPLPPVLIIMTIPIMMSLVPARTSTNCDDFVEQLNRIRLNSLETHVDIFPLLDTLKSSNGGQVGNSLFFGFPVFDFQTAPGLFKM